MSGSVAVREPRARAGIGRNFTAMMLWQVGNYLVPLATFPYLTRVLGPGPFGMLGFATAVAAYGIVFTEWGFNLSGPRAVVALRGDPAALNELVWTTVGAKACLCLVSFGVLLVALGVSRNLASITSAVLLAWLGVLGNVFALHWLLQGLERFSLFATIALTARLLMVPLTFLFVKGPADVALAAAIQASAPLVAAALSFYAAWRLGAVKRPHASFNGMLRRLKQGADMFVSTASVSLFSATHAVLLASMSGAYQVGIYAAADRIRTAGNMVPAQINVVLYPRISSLFLRDAHGAARLTAFGLLATGLATLAGVTLLCVFAQRVATLVLGAGFHGSATVLQLLCLATVFGNLAYFIGLQVLVPFGAARMRSRIMLACGCLSVALAILLIPGHGAAGAAAAFVAAEAAMLALYVVTIFRTPRLRAHVMQLAPGARR
jgi:O-antigen/teichoic acid export membrane protein